MSAGCCLPSHADFFVLIRCGGYGQPETHKRKVEK